MNRILIGVLIVMVLALAGMGYALRSQFKKAEQLTTQNEALVASLATSKQLRVADAKALAVSRAAQAALKKEKAAQDEALSKALAANPAWADQRVPDAVVDALGVR